MRFATLILLAFLWSVFAQAQPQSVPSLKNVPIPVPSNLSTYVKDSQALVVLGKALFWDLQIGSDGKAACASCHFHAGGDHRIQNQLANPLGSFPLNHRLTTAEFPFRQLSDPANNQSTVLRDSSQRTGSAGVFSRKLNTLIPGLSIEETSDVADAIFSISGLNVRRVTGRNAPSVINAVFNFRNFWDGRASEIFTGPTPFGLSDTRANLLSFANGSLQKEFVRLDNSSLASQSAGPVLNDTEMSSSSRSWSLVGKKMLALRPLAYQKIAADDSVLGSFANATGRGFQNPTSYLDLVKAAFQGTYWSGSQLVDESGTVLASNATLPASAKFTQAEYNFWLFFGMSVQAYESTLISDESRVDRFAEGQPSALTNVELAGMRDFTGGEGCSACHAGPETTLASHGGVNGQGPGPLRAGRDTGFFFVGVRPIDEDIGLGGMDGFNQPLASVSSNPQGRFKAPGLRNVELTGPYFHDGSLSTLAQVIQLYNRGGNFSPNASNGPGVRPLGLNPNQQNGLVAFLKALTDDRVRFERAPFDHPELCVADGQTSQVNGNPASPMSAADQWMGLPAVGRGGNNVPLQTFEELLSGIGTDGARAHNMTDACGITALTATGFVNANSASFQTGIVAQNSIVSAAGAGFTSSTASAATNPASTTLAGISVDVIDSSGISRPAPIFYASPGQINYAMPDGTAAGAATVNVSGGQGTFQTQLLIASVAPGIFGVQGMAAANVVSVRNGIQTVSAVIGVDAGGSLSLTPIDLGPADQQTFLILYGTGIRNHVDPVIAAMGQATATAAYAGAQGTFAGEDQINVLIPQSLKGAGTINVTLTVDGQITNAAKINIL